MSETTYKTPSIGDGATRYHHSDVTAWTVTSVSKSGKESLEV